MFLCPSDRFLALDAMGSSRIQPSSYMGNAGWPWNSTGINGTRSTVGRHNGIIGLVNPDRPVSWHDGDVRMEDVTDGMEYTIAVAERRIGNVQDAMDIILKRAYPTELSYCGGGNTPRVDLKAYSLSCSKASAADITYTRAHGRSWISGWTLAASTYLHVRPMNDINCHLYGGEPEGSNLVSPSSRHSGGIHVLMADGRVVFLSEGIDEHIWWGMGSRDGGEPNHFDE